MECETLKANSGIDAIEQLQQKDIIAATFTNGDDGWTVVYENFPNTGAHFGGRYAVLSNPTLRSEILGRDTWEFTKGDGHPCFNSLGEYRRNDKFPDYEPLIILHEFHDVVPDTLVVSEEFRLLMNLWEDTETRNFYMIGDDGSKDLAVKFGDERVEIRTSILRRYQAARQLDLVLYTDSSVYVVGDIAIEELSNISIPSQPGHGSSYLSLDADIELDYQKYDASSRLLAKRLVPAPPQEKSGIWPWENKPDFAEFIIAEDECGNPVKFTCDRDKLSNNFGANPDAPHYLTPVFFERQVLQRYYDDPELYSITSGHLCCATKWGVDIDNDNLDAVAVFLGDIGSRIPSSHWAHWQAYNIPPIHKMSESAYLRSFRNEWVESHSPEHQFKQRFRALQQAWHQNWGWNLHRSATKNQKETISRLRIPLNETDAEFKTQILNLALVLIDALNEKDISKNVVDRTKGDKGISKFKKFLNEQGYAYAERDVALLQNIQTVRSRVAAHESGSAGQTYLAAQLNGRTRIQYVADLMAQAVQMIQDLTELRPRDSCSK